MSLISTLDTMLWFYYPELSLILRRLSKIISFVSDNTSLSTSAMFRQWGCNVCSPIWLQLKYLSEWQRNCPHGRISLTLVSSGCTKVLYLYIETHPDLRILHTMLNVFLNRTSFIHVNMLIIRRLKKIIGARCVVVILSSDVSTRIIFGVNSPDYSCWTRRH